MAAAPGSAVDTGVPATVRALTAEAEEGLFSRGAQLYVSVGGEVVADVAVGVEGTGRPVTTETLFSVYCAAKPVTAVGIARLVDEGRLGLDDELGTLLPGRLCVGLEPVRLRDVLTHTAGLHRHQVITMGFLSPGRREGAVLSTPPPPGWRSGVDAAYSEYGGWHVLGLVIEAVAGVPLADFLRSEVLEPLGLVGDVYLGIPAAEWADMRARIGVNFDMRGLDPVPLVMERSDRVCTEWNPSFGGYATMRGLGHLYERLLAALAGEPGPVGAATLAAFTTPQRPAAFDRVLQRPCRFGFGFMVDLRHHVVGTWCSERSFGHLGFAGSTWAFADPEHGLVVALLGDGLLDPATAVGHRRPTLVDGIYRELGLSGAVPTSG
jgi:CubicO group peptidase (beta-lactamase class C family)